MSKYLENPNLPDSKVTKVIVDYRITKEAQNTLNKEGIEVIKTIPHPMLYKAVDGHPDMQIHHLGGNKFVCDEYVYDYYKKVLDNAKIYKGKAKLFDKYPLDIAYNAVSVGTHFFHNLSFTEKTIYEYYNSLGVKLINVKQGYSKCSVCILSKDAIISSDYPISNLAQKNGLDCLYFDPKDIKLNGLSNGFIGGICGLINRNTLAINGDITLLENAQQFIDFCNKYNINILPLNKETPEDIGSIIPIMQIWTFVQVIEQTNNNLF